MAEKRVAPQKAALIFVAFTAYFFLLLSTLLPFLKSNFSLNPALYWFITGYFLFIPVFIYALMMVKCEGNKGIKQISVALNIKSFTKKDRSYSVVGLLLAFVATGLIFSISVLLNKYFGSKLLTTTPWFMEMHPFQGLEKLLLLIWLPMFFSILLAKRFCGAATYRAGFKASIHGNCARCSGCYFICHLEWIC